MISTMREEPALARLDEIEEDIARHLTEGILFPDKRAQAAAAIVELHREGTEISRAPGAYRPPDPPSIERPDRRDAAIRRMVCAAFRGAPADDRLTDGLIDHWTGRLQECAGGHDWKSYDRASRLMREDAEVARRARATPCPFEPPEPPDNPAALLTSLATLTSATRERLDTNSQSKNSAWARGARQALNNLETTIRWVWQEGTSQQVTQGPAATAEMAAQLAQEFNEIRHAIGQRCPTKTKTGRKK